MVGTRWAEEEQEEEKGESRGRGEVRSGRDDNGGNCYGIQGGGEGSGGE